MLKVFVDAGGYTKAAGELQRAGLISLHHARVESRIKKSIKVVPVAGQRWSDDKAGESWAEDVGSWDDAEPSKHAKAIRAIVSQHEDSLQLDSAYRAGCSVFLTSDKGDIWRHRDAIEQLLRMKVLHSATEMDALRNLAKGAA